VSYPSDKVAAFMRRFGQPTPGAPCVPPEDVVRNRCRWQMEETLELLGACFGGDDEAGGIIVYLRAGAERLIDDCAVRVDLVAYADANADIRYVAYGNDIAAGIDSREVDAEVAASNDSKEMPDEPGGKVRKGAGYKPPNIAGILKDQGWKDR